MLEAQYLIDPALCLRCFLESREKMGLPRERALSLLRRCSSRTELFVVSYSLLALDGDPLGQEKRRLNELVLGRVKQLASYLGKAIEEGRELEVLAAANAVDVWMPWYEFKPSSLENPGGPAVYLPGAEAPLEALRRARRVALLLDNAGEAVVDALFALMYSELAGAKFTLVARSLPYEVDVTWREAVDIVERLKRELELKGAEVDVVGTESRYHAPHPLVSREARRALEEADLVISKGIANLEALLEYESLPPRKTVCVFKTKCPVLSRLFKVPEGSRVVSLGYTPPGR